MKRRWAIILTALALSPTLLSGCAAWYGYNVPDTRHRVWRAVWTRSGAGAAEVQLPALPGKRLHFGHRRGGLRAAGMWGGDRAVFGVRLRRHAHRGFLPGSPRLSAGGGADGHDCRTGVHQHRRGGGRAAYHGAAASVLQRRGHLHLPADGGDGHHFERIAYVAQIRLFFTLGQA